MLQKNEKTTKKNGTRTCKLNFKQTGEAYSKRDSLKRSNFQRIHESNLPI